MLEVEFADDGKNTDGLFYIQSNVTNDLRSYIAGKLVFDMRVTEGDTTDFTWKIDCRYPCGTGDQTLLGVEPGGEWQTFEILVSEAILKGLDIGKVNTPLVLFPSFGTPGQQGTTIQLDNIKWTIDAGEPPPPSPALTLSPTLPLTLVRRQIFEVKQMAAKQLGSSAGLKLFYRGKVGSCERSSGRPVMRLCDRLCSTTI